MHRQDGHPSSVYTAQVHPQRGWLATGGADNHVKIWDLSLVLRASSNPKVTRDVNVDLMQSPSESTSTLAALPQGTLYDIPVTCLTDDEQSGTPD